MKLNIELFKNKNFVLYWLAGWISSLGDAVFVIALTWLLVKETGSSVIVGTYLFVIGMTKMLFILFGGVVVDRLDNRKLLMASDAIRALLMVVFFMIGLQGFPPLWLFYLIGIIFGIVDSMAEPAGISARTRIVDERFYTQSMSLLMIAANLSAIIGPVLGSLLVVSFGPMVAILVNGLSFVVSFIFLIMIRFRPVEEEASDATVSEGFFAGFKSGLKFFLSTPILIAMAVFALFSNAAVGTTEVTIPFLAKQLGLGVEGFGLMNTGIGIGSAVGAIAFSIFVIKNPRPFMTLLTCFLQGIFIMLVGFTHSIWMIVGLFVLIGAHETAVNIIAPSVNHVLIPPKMFGRVISIMILIMSGSMPFAQALTGWFLTIFSPQVIFIGAGLLEIAAAIVTYLLPFVRQFGKDNELNHLATADR